MGTVSFSTTKTCLVCGKTLPRGWRDDTCRGCEFTDDWESRPIEHVLEDLTCDELAAIAPFGRSKAADVLAGDLPLNPEEEDFIRSRRHLIEPKKHTSPRASMASPPDLKRKAEPMEKDGYQIIPETLPGRMGKVGDAKWRRIVDEFLASGVPSARIEVQGIKHASSHYAMLRQAIGSDKRCYASVRMKRCYLVRVKEGRR